MDGDSQGDDWLESPETVFITMTTDISHKQNAVLFYTINFKYQQHHWVCRLECHPLRHYSYTEVPSGFIGTSSS